MAKATKKRRRAAPRSRAAAAGGGSGGSVLPTRELLEHQRALRRLAQALQRAGLDEFATQILELLARLRAGILDALTARLGDDEFQTREAAMDALMELLLGDPSIAEGLQRRREAATDPEIKDRIRRLLRANPALYRQQVADIGEEVGLIFIALNAPPESFEDSPELQRLMEELRGDAEQALKDAEEAETDLDETSIFRRFRRYEEREERRRARKPFIDQLRKEIYGK